MRQYSVGEAKAGSESGACVAIDGNKSRASEGAGLVFLQGAVI